jgi:hypothetical protein
MLALYLRSWVVLLHPLAAPRLLTVVCLLRALCLPAATFTTA